MTDSKEGKGKEKLWSINFNTLPYKIHFFLFLGAASAVLPFMAVFSEWKFALSGSELAIIFAAQQFFTFFTKPVIGAIVDRFNKMKFIMLTLITFKMIFFFMLLVIPGARKPQSLQVNSHRHSTAFTLDCDPITDSGMTCQLKETICYSLGHIERKANNSTDECLASDVHESELCHNGEFLCCDLERQFVPHSFKKQSLNCEELPIDSSSQITGAYKDGCIPFNLNKSDNSSRLQGHAVPENTEIYINDSTNYEMFFLCAHEMENGNNALKAEVFLLTDETSYLCRAGHLPDLYCGALADVTSVDPCLFRKNSSADSLQCIRSEPQLIPRAYNLWIFALIIICANICLNALFTLSDTACHESLQKLGGDYGRQRLWGSLSFGLLAPFTGILNDLATEASGHPDYTPGFYVFGVLAALEIVNVTRLDLAKPNLRGSVFKQVGSLFKSPSFVLFEFGVLMNGFFSSVIWFYLLLFLQTIGSSKLLMGLVLTTETILGEVPLMYFSGWILERLGYMNVLVLSSLCFSLRFIWFYFLYNPWWVLPVEITHGVCFGVFYAAMTSFAKSSAAKGTEATTQSLLSCTRSSLGSGLGCIVTGICFDHLGSRRTFLVLSLLSLIVALIQFVGSIWLRRRYKPVQIADGGLQLA